jgi:putative nucleotidyltransferase with HDIG domain
LLRPLKLCLNIGLIFVSLIGCFVEDIYLNFRPPQAEKAVAITIRAQHDFTFDQQTQFEEKRHMALLHYEPLYAFASEGVDGAKAKMTGLIENITNFQDNQQNGADMLSAYLKKNFQIKIDHPMAKRILAYQDLKKLLSGILTIEESVLRRYIIENSNGLVGKDNIKVMYPHPSGSVTVPVDDLISPAEARILMQEQANRLFWQVDPRVLDPVLNLSLTTLVPNLTYEHNENNRRIDKIVQRYPTKTLKFAVGDILIPIGKKPGEEGKLLLDAYVQDRQHKIYSSLLWNFVVILFTVTLFNLFFVRPVIISSNLYSRHLFLLNLLIFLMFFVKITLLLIPISIYGLPFIILPLILILLHHNQSVTLWVTLVGAILTTIFTGHSFGVFLYYTFGGLSAMLLFKHIEKRWHVLLPSLAVGFINAFLILIYFTRPGILVNLATAALTFNLLDWSEAVVRLPAGIMGWAFIGGMISGPLALLLLPVIELCSRSASTFKLNRFADLQHPLMKKLRDKCPGTYQHTMAVAHLVQTIGECIGADVLLLRIGAYYHDLGKTNDPEYFTENQFSGVNSHDQLTPEKSAKIIVDHVLKGINIIIQAGLPDRVVDLIRQHHGTQLVEYFYDKARKKSSDLSIKESDFRYAGPKPQTIEAAVLMVVDSIEAASRSIDDPNRQKLQMLVDRIIVNKLDDGQFDECNLTTRQLSMIRKTIVDSLMATLHSRIKYPWQENGEEPEASVAVQ